MVEFHHNTGFDVLKLGCTLPNLAIICLHTSTSARFYPFTESDENSLSKVREDGVGEPSLVLTQETVVDETLNRKSTDVCKSIVEKDASQFYP